MNLGVLKMKKLIILFIFTLVGFLFAQDSTIKNKSYRIITTNNDTINISWYRIGHSLFNSFCEYTLMNGKYSKEDLKMIMRIEDSKNFEMYPRGGIKETEKPNLSLGFSQMMIPDTSKMSKTEKIMWYQYEKKSPALAVLFSLFLPTSGHAYSGNWGRGLKY